jgi:transcriptional regulator with XRE-family HTH domain
MQTLISETRGMEKPLIATRVKTLREKAGLSQLELAIKTGLSLSLIAQIEQGKKADPRMSTLQALAEALGVDCNALTEHHEPKKPGRSRKK